VRLTLRAADCAGLAALLQQAGAQRDLRHALEALAFV
jgi:hypothetical protein